MKRTKTRATIDILSIIDKSRGRCERAIDSIRQRWIQWRIERPFPPIKESESVGAYGERIAVLYLKRKGYFVLERSFRTRTGEIDIIAVSRRRTIVFVEVKAWAYQLDNQGGPSDAVTAEKERKITDTALTYMKKHRLLEYPCRFDVIQIVIGSSPGRPEIRHIENAFEAVGEFQMFS